MSGAYHNLSFLLRGLKAAVSIEKRESGHVITEK
jgi:hypothetical protein